MTVPRLPDLPARPWRTREAIAACSRCDDSGYLDASEAGAPHGSTVRECRHEGPQPAHHTDADAPALELERQDLA